MNSKVQICFYCNKNQADGKFGQFDMYRIYDADMRGVTISKTIEKKKIKIERCSKCEKAQDKISFRTWLLSLIAVIIFFVLPMSLQDDAVNGAIFIAILFIWKNVYSKFFFYW